ncbi:hypothetical protein H4P12_08415 [Paracoccus sp. 11-3]|uniref:Peptidase n=1 Tax=Paracoccus amoyensis TaxID=2760093 RepID=A0A926GG81_9RHOB|nr:hypothetical protein [Paracoccus amoyensis]MBC9246734.1 hypothetical protein [Paracoccus amoyensis]
MTDKPLTARIEVFRSGTFTPMEGEPISYSAADLRAIADAYDPDVAPAPIVVGHPDTNAPAFGWVESFDYDATGDRLYANLHQIEPAFAELVKAGRFKKVSMQYFGPQQSHNPVPGTWYPKHVGFLGAAAPAVSGLKNVQFSNNEGVTFEAAFGERGFEEAAGLFRLLREFFIDRFGMEDADKALPNWKIEWLGEQADLIPSYSEQPAGRDNPLAPANPDPQPEEEPAVSKKDDPAFAERETALTAREQAIAERERKQTHDDNVSFAESLVEDGRLIAASKDKVVAILDALPGEAAVSFSEGTQKLTPAAALKEVLKAQPKVVSFGRLDMGDDPNGAGRPASFAADGKAVDPEGLATHNKALAYQRANPGTEYLDAVTAVS